MANGRRRGLALALATVMLLASAPARAEWFADVLGGVAGTQQASVTIEKTFPDPTYEVTREKKFEGTGVFAVRLGQWSEKYSWIGWAAEVARYHADSDSLRITFTPIWLTGVYRVGLSRSQKFPRGRFQPGVALGFGFVIYDLEADYRPVPPPTLSHSDVTPGVTARAQFAWLVSPHSGALAEYGFCVADIKPGYGVLEGAVATLRTHEALLGWSWRF